MRKHISIPIRPLDHQPSLGVVIKRLSDIAELRSQETEQSHRHDFHGFLVIEKGTVDLEIDFQRYRLEPSQILYIHPNQIHRTIDFNNTKLFFLGVTAENITPEHLNVLEEIVPAKPITIERGDFIVLTEGLSLSSLLFERKQDKMYPFFMIHSANLIVALLTSHYMRQVATVNNPTRFNIIAKAFALLLEKKFMTHKRPAEYAEMPNISLVYLNECIKNTTGFSITHQIHQRIVLEAKRMLYHSNKSVKEIAIALGYDDHAYFSRLFTKVAGMTALAFRKLNRD